MSECQQNVNGRMKKALCVNPAGRPPGRGLNPMDGIHSQYWRGPWAEGAHLNGSARRDQDSHAECQQGHKIAESTDS